MRGWSYVLVKMARTMPKDMRRLRARTMLESCVESLGVREVRCPACEGTGWASRRLLRRCPICLGFCEVPDSLADWFRLQRARLASSERRPDPVATPTALRGSGRAEGPGGEGGPRTGRAGVRVFRVHLPGA